MLSSGYVFAHSPVPLSPQISLFDTGIADKFLADAGKNNAACFQTINAQNNVHPHLGVLFDQQNGFSCRV